VIVTNNFGTVLIEPSPCGCSEAADDPPSILADGRSQTLARVPGRLIVSWAFEGDSLGCGLLPQGNDAAVITAGEEAGVVTVKATDSYGCEFYGVLELCEVGESGGCDEGGCEVPGNGQPRVGPDGPQVAWSMGRDGPQHHGGSIWLKPGTGVPLQSPHALKPHAHGSRTELIWGGNGALRQVKGPSTFVTVAVTATNSSGVVVGYELRFYPPGAAGVWLHDGYELLGGYTPNPVWQVINPDSSGATTNRLRIVEVRGSLNRTHDFEWLSATSRWKQTDGVTDREIYGWRESAGGGVTNLVREVKAGSTVLERRLRRYEPLQSGSTHYVVRRIEEGLSPNLRTTQYTHYLNSDPVGWRGRVKQATYPDGGWTIYEYDSSGRVAREYASYGDQAPTTNVALCRVTEYSYTLTQNPDGVNDNGSWMLMEPRKTIVRLKGNEVARTYRTLAEGQTVEKVCPLPGLLWTDAANLVTTNTTYTEGPHYGRPKAITHPDGTQTLYTYSETNGTFTTTVDRGEPQGAAIKEGTRTITVLGSVGEQLSRTTRVLSNSIPTAILAQDTYTYTDDFKRSYTLVSLGNRTNEVQYACCGLDTEIDWEGTPTSYEYDALGRRVATLRHGITHSNILDAAGRVLVRQRIGTDASVMTQDRYAYDVLGRVTAHTNALQGVTFYSEGLTNNKLHRLTVNPDQGQRLEIYYRDGRLEQVTNSAAFPVRYVHTVEQDGTGGPWREVTTEIRYRGDANTNEWVKTFFDGAGRPYKTVYPTPTGTGQRLLTYNNLGQLQREQDPDGVSTVYQYNAQGQLEYTALDLNTNGVIDWSGTDRITRQVESFTTYGGKEVRQTTRTVYTTPSSTATATVGRTRSSTDGLKTWTTLFTPTEVTTTNEVVFHRPSGARTNTVYLPDGSRTESIYSYGRLQSVTRKDSGGGQVTRTSYAYDSHGRVYAVTDARNGTTFTSYNAADQPVFVTTPDPGDGQGPQTSQTFYDTSGRTIGQWLPDGATTTNEYHLTGLLKKTWGARQYPVEYGYDAQGRMTNMVTWQSFNLLTGSGASPATNTWQYETNRGWLRLKGYPNASSGVATTNGPVYSYTAAGRLQTRPGRARWLARPGPDHHKYAEGTRGRHGDLSTVNYNDGTPGLDPQPRPPRSTDQRRPEQPDGELDLQRCRSAIDGNDRRWDVGRVVGGARV
jgi:YD repeat-containing protein